MAWFDFFLLGRPGYEIPFEVNPMAISFDEGSINVQQRNLAGDLKKSVFKSFVPMVKISSDYMTLNQRNQFSFLSGISDTFLSFQTRSDWQIVDEVNLPTSTLSVPLQNNSITKLSTLLDSLGFPGIITVNAVYTSPSPWLNFGYGQFGYGQDGYGGIQLINYFTGGIYTDSTKTITLGSALPTTNQVYVTYTYKGWLVNIDKISYSIQAGWIDRFKYDYSLIGV